jgi:DNA-binding beta-propeller fold protein YncE
VGFLVLSAIFTATAFAQSVGAAASSNVKTIEFVGSFQSSSDVDVFRTPCQRVRDSFDRAGAAHDLAGERAAVCDRVLDVIAGKAEPVQTGAKLPIRAVGIATDSHRRIVVTEPSTRSVHIFDFANRKYMRIDGTKNDRMLSPDAVAVDADDNLYVTDTKRGMIEVFNAAGNFKKLIGNFKGEGTFQQPNSIAIDRQSGRIYVADTPRHLVLILNHDGREIGRIGKRGGGSAPAEFNLPTYLALRGQELFVLDKRNERIQVFNLEGHYKREIKSGGLAFASAAGLAVDAEGIIYVLQDIGLVQVINPNGELLFCLGHYGVEAGEFKDSRGIFIDSTDRFYVADTGNLRVQVFQVTNEGKVVHTAAR